MRSVLVFALVGIIFAFAPESWANDGIPSRIFEVVQQGGDVEITVEIWDPGDPGMAYRWALDRVSDGGNAVIFEGVRFNPADADVVGEGQCMLHDGSYTSVDCDNDGVAECEGICEIPYYFDYVDECAPPGQTDYVLSGMSTSLSWFEVSRQSIVVTEWDLECGSDSDSDSGGSACSVTSFKNSSLTLLTLLVSLLQ